MRRNLLLLILTFLSSHSFCQKDTSTIYKKLKTRKFYSVSLLSMETEGNTIYKVNGNIVSKPVYDKYKSTWKNMERCCPCILESYDENDALLSEAVSCSDCGVGFFKEFYPNGTIRLSGKYKENSSRIWINLWERGFCSVPDGQWTYFAENGDTLYSEFWNDGNFIQQIPEQKVAEIWKVELTLDGEEIDKQLLTAEQIKDLVVIPGFKNSSRENVNLTINFEISAVGYKRNIQTFTLDGFMNVDIEKMLIDLGIPKETKPVFVLDICNNGITIGRYYLNIKL